jgi:hypothetical protein
MGGEYEVEQNLQLGFVNIKLNTTFLDGRVMHVYKVVSLMLWPPFTHRKIPITVSLPKAHSEAGWDRQIEKFSDLLWIRTHDLPTSSTVSQLAIACHQIMNRFDDKDSLFTECGRKKSLIWETNKNPTKQNIFLKS